MATGSQVSRPHGYDASAPFATVRCAATDTAESAMPTREYNPSNTIICDPAASPHASETTTNTTEAHIENTSARMRSRYDPAVTGGPIRPENRMGVAARVRPSETID